MELKVRNLDFELKQVDEAGQFSGFAAVYGVRDDLGDVIEPGAFTRTLQHRKGKFPLLWQHRIDEPLGFATVRDDQIGLHVQGTLNLEVVRAREVHALMKQAMLAGVPFGLSFGFDTLKSQMKGNVRHLTEVRLHEISPTLFPAQTLAVVASVKQASAREGKPFGPYESFQDCVSANQDKENPEGFCAWLHHEFTGEWPAVEKARMAERAKALFEHTPEIRLSREQVAAICPPCAEKMAQRGMTALTLTRGSVKQMPEQLLEGLCDRFGGDEGFFTRCVDGISGVDDPEAFCAWLHQECIGAWPGEKALASKANEYIRAASERLAALLRPAGPSQAAGSDSELASLWALMHEVRSEVRRRMVS